MLRRSTAHAGLSVFSRASGSGFAVELPEVAVDLLHEVRPVLVGAVDASLQPECFNGIDVRIAYDVLEMPLHGVNPALQIEPVLDGVALVWVADGRVDVVLFVVVAYGLPEDFVALLCESHFLMFDDLFRQI